MNPVAFEPTLTGWRTAARALIQRGVEPSDLDWSGDASGLLPGLLPDLTVTPKRVRPSDTSVFRVPAEFLDLASDVACADRPDRWDLLYRLLYRLRFENRDLLRIVVDDDVRRALRLRASVRHDVHKMHAFVRFKRTEIDGEEAYVAWHKPEHLICELAAPFFARRFGDRRWSVFTPDRSAHWNLTDLSFGPGMAQSEFKSTDDWDEVWKTYYRSIFNPARIKMKAMRSEMAPRYWSTLPEASLIRELVREAPKRLQDMRANQNAHASVDLAPSATLADLNRLALGCQACPLHLRATQTVLGAGPSDARILIVGEQPGDQEDLSGAPFVGPAGLVLDEALRQAGLSRSEVYVTNAVKHFKWEQRGKMRLHQKPSGAELHACKPWLEAEIDKVKPSVIVALGTTAGLAVLGRLPKIADERGRVQAGGRGGAVVIVSWHPAAILRARGESEAAARRAELAGDLGKARVQCERL